MSFWKAWRHRPTPTPVAPAPTPEPPAGAPLFVPPGHFYSPIVDPAEADRHLARLAAEGARETLPGIAIDRARMRALWDSLTPFLNEAPFEAGVAAGLRYHFENPSYAWGDGLMLHAMLRHLRPRRVVEVGSGYSSACLLDTLERYQPEDCDVTFVEPYPELLRSLLGSAVDRRRLQASRVQDCPLSVFTALEADDILFIDSTHVLKTGSDVWFELFRVLPALKPGVVVHFHDMFWPFEYPRHWAVVQNNSWNELYAMQAFLTHNAAYEVVMFNDYLAQVERPAIEQSCPRFLINPGGALWLRKLG